MRKIRYLQGACALAIVGGGAWAIAADHLDGAAAKKDAAADITDVYAWSGNDKLTLIMDVAPVATIESKFSDAVQYVFHVESSSAYGTAGEKTDIVCTFDTAQKVNCQLGSPGDVVVDFVTGDASTTAGITSDSLKMKVYAGLRADPFYFNLEGFNDAVGTVKMAAAGLTFDGAKCPTLDMATSMALIGQLQRS
ncbi:MAG TPA: DUF4331 family protein, partial [Polyangium sp.]|nr:DUF4331 family protein [Polyangium sp.]